MQYLCVRSISKQNSKNQARTELFVKGKTYRKISKNLFIAEDNKTTVHLFDDLIEECFVKINPSEIETEDAEWHKNN